METILKKGEKVGMQFCGMRYAVSGVRCAVCEVCGVVLASWEVVISKPSEKVGDQTPNSVTSHFPMNTKTPIRLYLLCMAFLWSGVIFPQQADSLWLVLTSQTTDPEHQIDSVLTFCASNKEQQIQVRLKLLQYAEAQLLALKDNNKTAQFFLATSRVHFENEDYSAAQDYAYRALNATPQDLQVKMFIYVQLGSIYYTLASYEKSLEFARKAFALSHDLQDSMEIAAGHNRIGDAHRRLGQRDSALYYLTQAVHLREELNDQQGLAKAHNNLGIYYIETDPMTMNAHVKALEAWSKSLQYKEAIADTAGMIFTHLNIARAGASPDRLFEEITFHLDRALTLAKATDFKRGLRAVYGGRAHYFNELNMYRKAYEAQKEYEKYDKELVDENTREHIAELEVNYETKLKEQEIDLLSSENETQSERLKKQSWMIGSGIAFSALLLVSLLTLRRNATLKLRHREQESQHLAALHEKELQSLKQQK
ncbi:MAG: tetratricopeptide repeat protein, partial [Saprospiraceae bacterium]|nr:tetratricopeptide repeat protein [Saprospiraceae bacterium]